MQYSPEFDLAGDRWRLKLYPLKDDGDVGLHLQLVGKGNPADDFVQRNWRLRALHPTDASRSVWEPDAGFLGPDTFVEGQCWGFSGLIAAAEVADFLHNGWVTLQALVWQPTAEEMAAAHNDPGFLQLLRERFSETDEAVIQRVIAQLGGNISRAFVELWQWSPVELKQPLKDEADREIFTWRVPLEQCETQHAAA